MRIGGIGNVYPTYVYNPNTVSAASLNKTSRISDNVLDKKVDYSETVAQENQNPLKKGQTKDFEGILAKQMQEGQTHALRIMPKGLKPEQDEELTNVVNMKTADSSKSRETGSLNKETSENAAYQDANEAQNGNFNMTQMGRAIMAYEMFMTA